MVTYFSLCYLKHSNEIYFKIYLVHNLQLKQMFLIFSFMYRGTILTFSDEKEVLTFHTYTKKTPFLFIYVYICAMDMCMHIQKHIYIRNPYSSVTTWKQIKKQEISSSNRSFKIYCWRHVFYNYLQTFYHVKNSNKPS